MFLPNAPAEVYQLHILLLHINPPVWRRLRVRSDTSIAILHDLLQIAFDWSDFHLHRFVIRGKAYGVSRLGGRANEWFLYEYDFGDLWRHQIRFESGDPCAEIRLATKAKPIQIAAINQMFSGMVAPLFVGLVVNHPRLFQGYEPAIHHLVENRKETVDFFLGVHDFHDQRQIHGKLYDLGGMNSAARSVAHWSTEHGGSSQVKFASL